MKSKGGCLKFKNTMFNNPKYTTWQQKISKHYVYTYLEYHLKPIGNDRKHWSKVHEEFNIQQVLVLSGLNAQVEEIKLPAKITLTRIAPRFLDYDNLVTAFKHIRDVVADLLIPGLAKGRADGDERLEWLYLQKKGISKEYAIKIEIQGF